MKAVVLFAEPFVCQLIEHVLPLRRQAFMFLDSPAERPDVSFRAKHGDGHYMFYVSLGQRKCFECGDVGHKWMACLHKRQGAALSEEAGVSAHTEPVARVASGDRLVADVVTGAASAAVSGLAAPD